MGRSFITISLAVIVAGCSANVSERDIAAARVAYVAAYHEQQSSPEQTLRLFFDAFLAQDAASLQALTIECPDRDELWSFGEPITQPDRVREFMQEPLRRVSVGETLHVPTHEGLKAIVVNANHVNDGRVMLLLGDHPIPWILVKIDGRWLVDPQPFIAAIQEGKKLPEKNDGVLPPAAAGRDSQHYDSVTIRGAKGSGVESIALQRR
jgi:hypothetical protein